MGNRLEQGLGCSGTSHQTPYRSCKDAGAGQQFGHAQVANLDGLLPRGFVLVDEDVGGLDVPVGVVGVCA